jgi:hypothetical protein
MSRQKLSYNRQIMPLVKLIMQSYQQHKFAEPLVEINFSLEL